MTVAFQGVDPEKVSEITRFFRGPEIRSKKYDLITVAPPAREKKIILKTDFTRDGFPFARITASILNTQYDTYTVTVEILQEVDVHATPEETKTVRCPKSIIKKIFQLFCPETPDEE